MTTLELPCEGGCRCGQVRLKISAKPLLTMACHCTGCQRMTGGPYSLSAAIPSDGFEVTKGEPVLGGLRQEPKHYHCPACKSWMFTKPSSMPWLVNLRPTMLDDHAWVRPFVDFFRDEGFPWAETGAKHVFETFPDLEALPGLIAGFAAEGARPG